MTQMLHDLFSKTLIRRGGGEERARSERASEIRKLRQTYTTLKAKERRKIQILQSKLMI